MKLTTIVREKQDRSAVVLDLPVGWDGKADGAAQPGPVGNGDPNPPPAGCDRYFLDVGLARDMLASAQSRLLWPAGFTFPDTQALGREKEPLPLRRLLAGGPTAMAVLGDLVETVRLIAQHGDGVLVAEALVPSRAARLRTPVPDAPLCYILHGNAVIVWRRQVGIDPTQHIMTRIPAMRIRTVNSLLGHDEPLYLPPSSKLSFGNELGFVIGQEARNVPAEQAYRYVAGYVCTNDCYSNVYSPLAPDDAPNRISSTLQVGDKSTDGCGPVGPWIATSEDVGDPHDLILLTRQDGLLRNRSHSGAYIVGVEEAVERLSHRFPLLPGTIVTLGAAGWDGVTDEPVGRASGHSVLEVEVERIGVLRTPLIYPDANEQAERDGGSPYIFVGTVDSTTPLDRFESDGASPTALPGLPPPRGFWTLFGNQREAEQLELEQTDSPAVPAAVAYPVTGLRCPNTVANDTDGPTPIPVLPNAGTIRVTCHLAIVIGPEPAYAETAESAAQRIAGYGALLSIHDAGTLERLKLPTTDYERRFAIFFGYLGAGHHVLAPVTAAGDLDT
ncbi:MAG: hypothetical protein CL878_11835, partial [Dehalococcoidia bacterium]|nr:hypothetical protein [Dehalococcoidia bacterium]